MQISYGNRMLFIYTEVIIFHLKFRSVLSSIEGAFFGLHIDTDTLTSVKLDFK